MKRYHISAPSSSLYEESPDGQWVEWEEVDEALAAKDAIIAELRLELTELNGQLARMQRERNDALAKLAGPRCDLCGNLCVDAAKDESGYCPDCSALAGQIEFAGYLARLEGEKP